jgi:purine nucleosidase
MPSDQSKQTIVIEARVDRFKHLGNRAGKLIAQILTSYERHDIGGFGCYGGPLHDPCAIGYLLEPSLFAGRRVKVAIETRSDLTFGETVVDWNEVTRRPPNALWINEVDADEFYSLLTETVTQLP